MNEAQYPIQLVARLIGLSAHVIRIWEQRLWRDGTLTSANEHFASASIRVFLGNLAKPFCSTLDNLCKPARKAKR
jgi:hypothetical protein